MSIFAALFKNYKLINEFRKNSQGMTSDTWNLKYPQIKTIKVYLPKVAEQEKVASFLVTLEKESQHRQRLSNSSRSIKEDVIQRVFSGRKGNGKDHCPTWEVSSFGEFFTEQIIKTSNSPDTPLVMSHC